MWGNALYMGDLIWSETGAAVHKWIGDPAHWLNGEKSRKILQSIGIGRLSGSLEPAKAHMNATILGGSPERRANSRLAVGTDWI
jgi:hypothetical protein